MEQVDVFRTAEKNQPSPVQIGAFDCSIMPEHREEGRDAVGGRGGGGLLGSLHTHT